MAANAEGSGGGGGRASAAVVQDKDKSANKGTKLEKLDLQPPKVTDFGRLYWGGVCVCAWGVCTWVVCACGHVSFEFRANVQLIHTDH